MEFPNEDNRSFAKHAGTHGFPDGDCWHGPKSADGWPAIQLFLPWHRAYLYRLEKDLQDQVPGVTIPYWDWRTEEGETEKIPEAFSTEAIDGEKNPLYGFHINYPSSGVVGNTFRQIDEDPNEYPNLPRPDAVEKLYESKEFQVFSNNLRIVHNEVHVWAGGTMGSQRYAAFDPIFWAHHCMVDKIWWDWQQDNNIENIPSQYKTMSLLPFEGTVQKYLDVFSLGYDYSEDSKKVTGGWQ
jgi:tyrosinase